MPNFLLQTNRGERLGSESQAGNARRANNSQPEKKLLQLKFLNYFGEILLKCTNYVYQPITFRSFSYFSVNVRHNGSLFGGLPIDVWVQKRIKFAEKVGCFFFFRFLFLVCVLLRETGPDIKRTACHFLIYVRRWATFAKPKFGGSLTARLLENMLIERYRWRCMKLIRNLHYGFFTGFRLGQTDARPGSPVVNECRTGSRAICK